MEGCEEVLKDGRDVGLLAKKAETGDTQRLQDLDELREAGRG